MYPLKYEEPIYRPPSEGRSFLIQLTIGCSNNRCTYCDMYRSKKYRERSLSEIKKELIESKQYFDSIGYEPKRIFLCDADALGASMHLLVSSLELINQLYPKLNRVGIYATAQNMLDKTPEELRTLKKLKLSMAYLGLESGSNKVLHMIAKGNNRDDMLRGSKKLMDAGIKLSIIAMLGIGGEENSQNHTEQTASIISEISPDYFSFLTTIAIEGTPYKKMLDRGNITELTSRDLFMQMKKIIEGINPSQNIIFRANHVSNQFPLAGNLPQDSSSIIKTIDLWIKETPEGIYPPIPLSM